MFGALVATCSALMAERNDLSRRLLDADERVAALRAELRAETVSHAQEILQISKDQQDRMISLVPHLVELARAKS